MTAEGNSVQSRQLIHATGESFAFDVPITKLAQPNLVVNAVIVHTAMHNQLEVVKYLVSLTDANNKPLVDVNKGDNDGRTALHWAATYGQLEVVNYLVSLTDANNKPLVDVNRGDNDGMTALHCRQAWPISSS